MMCASPDFIQRDASARSREIEKYRAIIDAVALLGGQTCRILSGQRQPDVERAEGVGWVVEAIEALLPTCRRAGRDPGDGEPLQGWLLAVSRVCSKQ